MFGIEAEFFSTLKNKIFHYNENMVHMSERQRRADNTQWL
jgi:hypothetical protein